MKIADMQTRVHAETARQYKQRLIGVALGGMHNMQMIAKIINNSHGFTSIPVKKLDYKTARRRVLAARKLFLC
jgi:hypothetical protein